MISLSKGQKVDLTKGNAGLRHLLIGLGWQSQGNNFDLDTAALPSAWQAGAWCLSLLSL